MFLLFASLFYSLSDSLLPPYSLHLFPFIFSSSFLPSTSSLHQLLSFFRSFPSVCFFHSHFYSFPLNDSLLFIFPPFYIPLFSSFSSCLPLLHLASLLHFPFPLLPLCMVASFLYTFLPFRAPSVTHKRLSSCYRLIL